MLSSCQASSNKSLFLSTSWRDLLSSIDRQTSNYLKKLSSILILQSTHMQFRCATYVRKSTFHQLWFISWLLYSTTRRVMTQPLVLVYYALSLTSWCEIRQLRRATTLSSYHITLKVRALQFSKHKTSTTINRAEKIPVRDRPWVQKKKPVF